MDVTVETGIFYDVTNKLTFIFEGKTVKELQQSFKGFNWCERGCN
jgi:hypothetical protein